MAAKKKQASKSTKKGPARPVVNKSLPAKHPNRIACAALSYLLIGIIWYFADEEMRKDRFARFHAQQGIVFLISALVIQIVGSIIPFIGWFIIWPIGTVLILVWFILGLINALNEKEQELFWIGGLGKQLKI